LRGDYEHDAAEQGERFSNRSKFAQEMKMRKTADLRDTPGATADMDALPLGVVAQVYSMFIEIEFEGAMWLATMRSSMRKLRTTDIIVGDRVRFRSSGLTHQSGRPEAVIELILPRQTVLLRADSFKGLHRQPVVANAGQMLIVASILRPRVKWGLVDRMLIAAQSGGLKPIVCLNKMDLALGNSELLAEAEVSLGHYRAIGVAAIGASVTSLAGLEEIGSMMRDQTTVLAGHSGVGKSSLIHAISPDLDLKIGEVSNYNDKGRHTTTSARQYRLSGGGIVIDTPGVKHFGLWNVTAENLEEFFPDVAAGDAPPWRVESYQNILGSLA
jgi:ribosome biogenesis GTPase